MVTHKRFSSTPQNNANFLYSKEKVLRIPLNIERDLHPFYFPHMLFYFKYTENLDVVNIKCKPLIVHYCLFLIYYI